MNEQLRNLKEKDPKKKPKWYEKKEYQRLRNTYTDTYTPTDMDKVEVMERSERRDAKRRCNPQYI